MPEADETLDEELETEPAPEPDLRGAAAASALKKERKARQEAEKQTKELAARLKRIEDAEKSETERLRAELDDLKERDKERESAVERERTDRERADRVRRAAKELNFADEDDTVALLRGHGLLDDIESDEDATSTLKRLAKAKPHLVRTPGEENQSLLDRVLNDGKPAGPRDTPDQSGAKTGDEMYGMTDEEFLAWREKDPAGYRKSLEGWTGNETHARLAAPQVGIAQ